MNIVTKYTSNKNGTGQIRATSGGKQKTVPWDHSLTREQNFANGAAALIVHLGISADAVDPESYTYREKDNAHVFAVRVA